MKKLFLLCVSLFFQVASVAAGVRLISCETRFLPEYQHLSQIVFLHETAPGEKGDARSFTFEEQDFNELCTYDTSWHPRSLVFNTDSTVIKEVAKFVANGVEKAQDFSLVFDLKPVEKQVLGCFIFKKKKLIIHIKTADEALVPSVANMLKSLLLDESFFWKKHGSNVLMGLGVVAVGGYFAMSPDPRGSGGNSGNGSGGGSGRRDPDPEGNVFTFEQFFLDYLKGTTLFPYKKKNVRQLTYILGKVGEDGKLHGSMSFAEAESAHDWVQWAFPTQTKSRFNDAALTSTPEFQKLMRESRELRSVLLLCFRYYLNFMGFDLDVACTLDTKVSEIVNHITFVSRKQLTDFEHEGGGHNLTRSSRILESLRIHGLEEYAKAFYWLLTDPMGIEQDYSGFAKRNHASRLNWWNNGMGLCTKFTADGKPNDFTLYKVV